MARLSSSLERLPTLSPLGRFAIGVAALLLFSFLSFFLSLEFIKNISILTIPVLPLLIRYSRSFLLHIETIGLSRSFTQ